MHNMGMVDAPVLAVDALHFEYADKRVLEQVSFSLSAGSVTALVGPNGAGKTTLMRCIAGLERPFSGSITLHGVDVLKHPRQAHTQLGYVSDFFGVYEGLSVQQSLAYIARLRGMSGRTEKAAIDRVVERLDLASYFTKPATALSRGWRQRLGIAQAMLHEPNLLILDEPASGLDPEARVHLSQLFHQLKQEGVTLLVSSHILAELEDYCSHMLLIRDGGLTAYDSRQAGAQCPLSLRLLHPPTDAQQASCAALANTSNWQWNDSSATALFAGEESALPALIAQLVEAGLPLLAFSSHQRSLQDLYMEHATQPQKEPNDAR